MTDIYNFWLEHPQYWISLGKKQHEADDIITSMFYTGNNLNIVIDNMNNDIGKVIYLDQFSRHFQRVVDNFTEVMVYERRKIAVVIARSVLVSQCELNDKDLYFLLMPFKHLGYFTELFKYYSEWTQMTQNTETPFLRKFYEDTVSKYYKTLDYKEHILLVKPCKVSYDPSKICEYYNNGFRTLITDNEINLPFDIPTIENPIISISGGVDSMVILALYKIAGANPCAVHIGYGNRREANEEFELIKDYCFSLDVPLYYFQIDYVKRGQVDREFYEEITRFIRFSVYRSLSLSNPTDVYKQPNIILGHIRDDVVENIWTNFANDRNIDNLKKMEPISLIDDVMIHRPLLNKTKKDILAISNKWGIPFTLNTTPSWSNRGKFREHFYQATHSQYGDNVDERIIRVAEKLKRQTELIHKLLYKPILDSWNGEYFKMSNHNHNHEVLELEKDLDLQDEEWVYLLKQMFRTAYSIEPSRKSCLSFIQRLGQNSFNKHGELIMPMTRNYTICFNKHTKYFRIFACQTS